MLKGNFQNSSIKVQWRTAINFFCRNFMPICPVTKKCEFIVTKNPHPFSPPFFRRFGPGCQNFNTRFEFGLHNAC